MEDNEEEEDDDSYPGHGFPEYDDTTMREEAEPVMREEAGCRHVPCMTPLLKMTCTCCPSYHLRI